MRLTAIIVVKRRQRHSERRCVFSTCVNIFGMTEAKIIHIADPANAILEPLDELRVVFESVTHRSHAVPALLSFCFPGKTLHGGNQ